jgi:hypothetical protein
MTIFGGCAPLIMSAIQTGTGSIFIGPGLWMTGEVQGHLQGSGLKGLGGVSPLPKPLTLGFSVWQML